MVLVAVAVLCGCVSMLLDVEGVEDVFTDRGVVDAASVAMARVKLLVSVLSANIHFDACFVRLTPDLVAIGTPVMEMLSG